MVYVIFIEFVETNEISTIVVVMACLNNSKFIFQEKFDTRQNWSDSYQFKTKCDNRE